MSNMQNAYWPEINFVICEDLEFKCINYFWQAYGVTNIHQLKPLEAALKRKAISKDEGTEFIRLFVDDTFSYNRACLKDGKRKVATDWYQIEEIFFTKVDQLLGGWPWPKGAYTGSATYLNRFPYFLKDKHFAFPCFTENRNKDARRVIAHEMLHFITFDYLEKKFNLLPVGSRDADNTIWRFTEIYNTLLESSDFWQDISRGVHCGPSCKKQKMYWKMKKYWDRGVTDIDVLIDKMLIRPPVLNQHL